MKNIHSDKPYENMESDETRMNLINLPSMIKQKKEMGLFYNEYKVSSICPITQSDVQQTLNYVYINKFDCRN